MTLYPSNYHTWWTWRYSSTTMTLCYFHDVNSISFIDARGTDVKSDQQARERPHLSLELCVGDLQYQHYPMKNLCKNARKTSTTAVCELFVSNNNKKLLKKTFKKMHKVSTLSVGFVDFVKDMRCRRHALSPWCFVEDLKCPHCALDLWTAERTWEVDDTNLVCGPFVEPCLWIILITFITIVDAV